MADKICNGCHGTGRQEIKVRGDKNDPTNGLRRTAIVVCEVCHGNKIITDEFMEEYYKRIKGF